MKTWSPTKLHTLKPAVTYAVNTIVASPVLILRIRPHVIMNGKF